MNLQEKVTSELIEKEGWNEEYLTTGYGYTLIKNMIELGLVKDCSLDVVSLSEERAKLCLQHELYTRCSFWRKRNKCAKACYLHKHN